MPSLSLNFGICKGGTLDCLFTPGEHYREIGFACYTSKKTGPLSCSLCRGKQIMIKFFCYFIFLFIFLFGCAGVSWDSSNAYSFSDFLRLVVLFLAVSKQKFIFVLHDPFAVLCCQNNIIFCETGEGVRPCVSTVEFSVPNFLKGKPYLRFSR